MHVQRQILVKALEHYYTVTSYIIKSWDSRCHSPGTNTENSIGGVDFKSLNVGATAMLVKRTVMYVHYCLPYSGLLFLDANFPESHELAHSPENYSALLYEIQL